MTMSTVPVGEAKPHETAPRRNVRAKNGPWYRPIDMKASTLIEFLEEVVRENGNGRAMGWRDMVNQYHDTKKVTKIVDDKEQQVDKTWTYFEMSEYKYVTYPELLTLCKQYGRGLTKLGIEPDQKSKVHIYAATSQKWMQTFMACQTKNIPIVTAYDTLGEEGLTHSLLQTELDAIFTDNTLLGSLVRPLSKATTVKYIIHNDKIDPEDKRIGGKYYEEAKESIEAIAKVRPDIKFISFDDCVELGKNDDLEVVSSKTSDLACIMYTSGSTGPPKGVELTQENMLSAIGGTSCLVGKETIKKTDRIIAFLPLAHIFEMVFELLCLYWGGCIGYANVKTLTETSVRNCKSDLAEFEPTIMVGVAAVWELVRKGVLAKVKKLPYLKQKIFWTAYLSKYFMSHYNIPGSKVFDIIFKPIKEATGGHLRYVMNGGSPISLSTQKFISNLIGPMLIGYGLTETTANGTLCPAYDLELGVSGPLVASVTAKLVDVAETGYFSTNNQGELWLKGPCITKEYYKNPKETKEAFSEDGWFMTGDIAEWTSTGALRIIDRKKNLVKTLNGEYVALEKLESAYKANPVVGSICVYADQTKSKPIAIILPNEVHLRLLLQDRKVYSEEELEKKELATLCADKRVTRVTLESLLNTGHETGFKGTDLLQNVVLLDDEWTPQNGMVTSAQKLQRKKILASCQKQVNEAYK